MYTYSRDSKGRLLRSDGVIIPELEANNDYAEFLASGQEAAPYIAPTPTSQELIATLEGTVTPRMMREAALGGDNSRLKAIEDKIEAIRATIAK